jgi:hypothetical protein
MDQGRIIYEEKKKSFVAVVFLSLWAAFCIFAIAYQSVFKFGEFGANPAPSWVYLVFLVFTIICLIVFKQIRIIITTEAIDVGFNKIFSKKIGFEEIEGVEMDNKSYGGSGIRTAFVKGKIRTAYNVGQSRIVIAIKNKKREIAFSTNNPEEIIKIVKSHIR